MSDETKCPVCGSSVTLYVTGDAVDFPVHWGCDSTDCNWWTTPQKDRRRVAELERAIAWMFAQRQLGWLVLDDAPQYEVIVSELDGDELFSVRGATPVEAIVAAMEEAAALGDGGART